MKNKRSAIKHDLFGAEQHRRKIDALGDPLIAIGEHIDFAALAERVDRATPRPEQSQAGRPPFPTETMVRILVLKRLYNLSGAARITDVFVGAAARKVPFG